MTRRYSVAAAVLALTAVVSIPAGADADSWRYFAAAPAFATAHRPEGVAVDSGKNLVYLTNPDEGTVSVVDGATRKPVGEPIPVGPAPWAVAVNSQTHKAYVSDSQNGAVYVIAGDSPAVTSVIPVGAGAYGLAIDEVHNRVHVVGYTVHRDLLQPDLAVVETIDGATDDYFDSTELAPAVYVQHGAGIALDPSADRLYVTLPDAGIVEVLRASTLTALTHAIVPGGSMHLAVNTATHLVYVSNGPTHSVSVLSSEGRIVKQIDDVNDTPAAVTVDESTDSVFVSDGAGISVAVIDGGANEIVGAPIEVGSHPSGLAFDPVGATLWAANLGDSTVTPVAELATPDISTAQPPAGRVGDSFSFRIRAAGSPSPTFLLSSDTLPRGLKLDGASGVLSGTPTEAGTFTFRVVARNATSVKSEGRYSITVAP